MAIPFGAVPQYAARLTAAIVAAGTPVAGIDFIDTATSPPTITVRYAAGATGPQIANGAAVVAGFDWSQAAQDVFDTAAARAAAKVAITGDRSQQGKELRAVAIVLNGYINAALTAAALPTHNKATLLNDVLAILDTNQAD